MVTGRAEGPGTEIVDVGESREAIRLSNGFSFSRQEREEVQAK